MCAKIDFATGNLLRHTYLKFLESVTDSETRLAVRRLDVNVLEYDENLMQLVRTCLFESEHIAKRLLKLYLL